MKRRIDLKEHDTSEYPLSAAERDTLLSEAQALGLSLAPVVGSESVYSLRPGSIVGAVEIGELSVFIEPKIGIPQLLSLACYAIGRFEPRPELFDFTREDALPDVLALALASAAGRAFAQGLLHGYRTEEEALYTVRGRIRFDEQMRRRFGLLLPVEVRYDEFTDDILANRLVRAAAARLGGMRLRPRARTGLGWVMAMLDNVSPQEFPPNAVPEVRFDRLNEHYREVVTLSRLVLRHGAFESRRGDVRASGFLMDMNVVFQELVTVALREALGVSERVFCSDKELMGLRRIYLDNDKRIRLEPDLTWWDGDVCRFVGDAKYKNLTSERAPPADLYQLLAYVTALDLPGGLLIYAKGESDTAAHLVRHSGKRLQIAALDLSGTLDEVLDRVRGLAEEVTALRDEALAVRAA